MNLKLQDSLIAARKILHDASPYRDMAREDLILRDYMVQIRVVEHVDNEGETCGYCCANEINCNIYATVTTDSGRAEESAWSSCDTCAIYSIDQIEDVDTAHLVIIERAGNR